MSAYDTEVYMVHMVLMHTQQELIRDNLIFFKTSAPTQMPLLIGTIRITAVEEARAK